MPDSTSSKGDRSSYQELARTNRSTPLQNLSCYGNTSTIALSQVETILLSSSGDVLVSRCRSCPYPMHDAPYQWQDDVAMLCWDAQCDDLAEQMKETSLLCSPGGLLGGSPAAVSPVPTSHHQNHHHRLPPEKASGNRQHHLSQEQKSGLRLYGGGETSRETTGPSRPTSRQKSVSLKNRAQKAFSSPPLVDTGFDEEGSIVPIRSFDYSHFKDGGNDMLPPPNTFFVTPPRSTNNSNTTSVHSGEPAFFQGIPAFFPAFAQVKITQVSAHPLGSHCLFISNAGLLYSYGLNNYGQLGIGLKTRAQGTAHRGYIPTPNIVTPLVENGGKAILCAAGVSHSLVVVVTEERRLVRSSVNGESDDSTESIVHHQMYGFGRNDFMKIGLVSPKLAPPGSEDETENVLLPRRVALRCKVLDSRGGEGDDPPLGIFAVEASAEHSAALVRRATGDVELYTWGNATYGALGLPHAPGGLEKQPFAAIRVVPVPSFVAALSRISNPHAKTACMLLRNEYPTCLSLGYRCSFLSTSLGRCFSFGVSDDGLLGLGDHVRESQTPSEIPLPLDVRGEKIRAIRAGATAVLATTFSGAVLGWGTKRCIGLDGTIDDAAGPGNKKRVDPIEWSPKRIDLFRDSASASDERIVQACAGFDNAVFISGSGRVLSCGKASGRLGAGEVERDVLSPQSMFGGLRLWTDLHISPPAHVEQQTRGSSSCV
jgi:alpha-tubulin suppressor-like RCC1 family protein